MVKTDTMLRASAAFFLSIIMICGLRAADTSSNPVSALKLDRLHQTAPELTLYNGDPAPTHLSDYRGHPVILHFWASWCAPCRKELQALKKLVDASHASGITFLPVSADDPSQIEKARQFISSVPGDLPVFVAGRGKEHDEYLAWGVPVTYFVDSSGKIIARAMGARDWASQPDLPQLIAALFDPNSKSAGAKTNK